MLTGEAAATVLVVAVAYIGSVFVAYKWYRRVFHQEGDEPLCWMMAAMWPAVIALESLAIVMMGVVELLSRRRTK